MIRVPHILVTTSRSHVALNYSKSQYLTYSSNTILDILVGLGCVPVLLPNGVMLDHVDEVVKRVDGLVLSPGRDIAPEIYKAGMNDGATSAGVQPGLEIDTLSSFDCERDRLEIALYRAALVNRRPVLGICRGMQIINVAEGGTLQQHLPENGEVSHSIDEDGWINYHSIEIVEGSRLSEILKVSTTVISSIHHQGVERLGRKLVACAHSEDGVVEAVESQDRDRFVLGLQGHFEKGLRNQRVLNNIWKAYVNSVMLGGRDV